MKTESSNVIKYAVTKNIPQAWPKIEKIGNVEKLGFGEALDQALDFLSHDLKILPKLVYVPEKMPGLVVSKNTAISKNFCVSESTEVVRVCQLLEFQKYKILVNFLCVL